MATINTVVEMCECRDCGNRHFPKKAVAAKPDRECVVCLKKQPYEEFYTGGAPSGRCHDCREAAKTQRIERCSVCKGRFWVPKSFVWYLGLKCERCKEPDES